MAQSIDNSIEEYKKMKAELGEREKEVEVIKKEQSITLELTIEEATALRMLGFKYGFNHYGRKFKLTPEEKELLKNLWRPLSGIGDILFDEVKFKEDFGY
jgi:hypothetical protein